MSESKLTASSLKSIPVAFASCSIGSPSAPNFPLEEKLAAIAQAGFKSIELSFPDLQAHASKIAHRSVAADDYDALVNAAHDAKQLCQQHGLDIFVLQPFGNFEGWPKGSTERDDAFQRLHGWIRIMKAADIGMLQVGSSDSEGIATDRESVAADLRELADILAKDGLKVAYENWCWSSHASTWKDIWEISKLVDRDNFGLNVDTFQSAGYEYADPRQENGLLGGKSEEEVRKNWETSLQELVSTVPGDKIFFLQISDAYKPIPKPLEDKVVDGLRPRAFWSHYYRPLPYAGGYLPVVDFTKAVLRTGFRGIFSMEVFDGGADGKGHGATDLKLYATEAMNAYNRLISDCTEEE